MPRALVTGIGGQDGSMLAELLVERGYEVIGTVRDPERDHENLAAVADQLRLVKLDLEDEAAVARSLADWGPAEVYNLASISLVPRSWDEAMAVARLGAVGLTALLEGIRRVDPSIRLFQASSAEIFGEAHDTPQTEHTPLAPVTPYGVAKAYGHFLTGAYRRRYGLFACSGILFNHESPRRSEEFVTRKVAAGAARISLGLAQELRLGSLEARRDWGYAGDTVRAMWLMLQEADPDDYVVATGEPHSVEEFVRLAFEHVGLDWRAHVVADERFTRGSAEIWLQAGDASKARERLGWEPTVRFEELVHLMVDADVERIRAQLARA